MGKVRRGVLLPIGILAVLAVVAVVLLLARAPAPDNRARPDAGLVQAALDDHQAVLDSEWTDPEASTGAPSPMAAEETIRHVRDGLAQDGLPVTSATSSVHLDRATFQDDGSVLAAVTVTTTYAYEGGEPDSAAADPHWMTLTGSDATGYSVVQDEVIDETAFKGTLDGPDEVQRRADLIGLAISVVFGALALAAAFQPWLVRRRLRLARPDSGRLTGFLTALLVGGPAVFAVALTWLVTLGGASTISDFDGSQATCMRERLTSLDSRLESGDGLWHGCVAHSRIDVGLALVIAMAVVVVEYLILNEDPGSPSPTNKPEQRLSGARRMRQIRGGRDWMTFSRSCSNRRHVLWPRPAFPGRGHNMDCALERVSAPHFLESLGGAWPSSTAVTLTDALSSPFSAPSSA